MQLHKIPGLNYRTHIYIYTVTKYIFMCFLKKINELLNIQTYLVMKVKFSKAKPLHLTVRHDINFSSTVVTF